MIRKFEFTSEEKMLSHTTSVRRIRALIDIPNVGVKAGELGGFIMCQENLSHEGDCWVFQEAMVHGLFTRIEGNARIYGHAVVEDGSIISDGVVISDHAHISQSNIKGESIFIRDETVVERSIIKGELIYIEDKTRISNVQMQEHVQEIRFMKHAIIENSTTPLHISGSFLTITGNAYLSDVKSISGKTILIDQNAVVQKGVIITGKRIRLYGASSIEGNIDVNTDVELSECVSIFNIYKEYIGIHDVKMKGDFHRPAFDFQCP